MSDEQDRIIGEEDICFVTGKIIPKDEPARFTSEFDAWISEEGQKIVEERATSAKTASMMSSSQKDQHKEAYIIYGEWYAKDEAAAGNEEFRRWHR